MSAKYELAKVLADRVKSCREKKHFSQRDFAFECGVPYGTLSNIERGQCNVTFYQLRVFALVLGLSIQELLGDCLSIEIALPKPKRRVKTKKTRNPPGWFRSRKVRGGRVIVDAFDQEAGVSGPGELEADEF